MNQLATIQTYKNQAPCHLIMAFREDYSFLSNHYECRITLEEEGRTWTYKSTENAYMAWKVVDSNLRAKLQTVSPRVAKDISKSDAFQNMHRADYTDVNRVIAMLKFNRQKYSATNPELRQKLFNTGHATLIEGTTWNDKFFGLCLKTGTGHNYLGRILMTIRDELRVEEGLSPLHGDLLTN